MDGFPSSTTTSDAQTRSNLVFGNSRLIPGSYPNSAGDISGRFLSQCLAPSTSGESSRPTRERQKRSSPLSSIQTR